jgi:CxxC motif-containing protein
VEEKDGRIAVTGNECKRGADHGEREYSRPSRMLTGTVAIEGGILPRLSVVSTDEVPRAKLRECLNALYRIKVKAPVRCGDKVIANVCGTGVDIVASRSMG